MLLWPLITPGVLPQQMFVTPLPPYSGPRNATSARPHAGTNTAPRPAVPTTFVFRPHVTQPRAPETAGGPPSLSDIPAEGTGPGPAIPGGLRDGAPISIVPPETHRGPIKASAGVMSALLVHRAQPEYPAIARAMGLSGTVELRAIIGTDGAVRELEVVSGNTILAQAAIAAVQQWRYQPTRLNGEPVEVETHITVNFVMK